MNFTYTLKKPPDLNWGSLQKDGTWNGMVRLLQDQEADIGKYMIEMGILNKLPWVHTAT